MRLQKQTAYTLDKGGVQYKYSIIIPEQIIQELGWREGSELRALVNRKSLVIRFQSGPEEERAMPATPKMAYEQFRDKIRHALQYKDNGMTWTQVRRFLSLDQVVPNNKWVRRLERDIGLERIKGPDGLIRWRVNHVK